MHHVGSFVWSIHDARSEKHKVAHKVGKVVSPTHLSSLLPENIPGRLLISVRGCVNPRTIVRPEGLCQWHLRESNPRPIPLLVRRSFISVNGITFVNEICLRASLTKQDTVFSLGLYTLWTPA